jgi:hypothetical protein
MDHKWGKSAWLGDCREHRTNPVHAMTPDVWGKARSSPTGVVDVLPRLVVSLQRRRPADTAEGQRDPGLVRQVRLPGDCPNRRPIECLLGRGLGTRADGVVCAKEVARCRIAFEPTPSGLRRDRDRTPGSRRCASATRGYGSQALHACCRWRSIPRLRVGQARDRGAGVSLGQARPGERPSVSWLVEACHARTTTNLSAMCHAIRPLLADCG